MKDEIESSINTIAFLKTLFKTADEFRELRKNIAFLLSNIHKCVQDGGVRGGMELIKTITDSGDGQRMHMFISVVMGLERQAEIAEDEIRRLDAGKERLN